MNPNVNIRYAGYLTRNSPERAKGPWPEGWERVYWAKTELCFCPFHKQLPVSRGARVGVNLRLWRTDLPFLPPCEHFCEWWQTEKSLHIKSTFISCWTGPSERQVDKEGNAKWQNLKEVLVNKDFTIAVSYCRIQLSWLEPKASPPLTLPLPLLL